MEFESEEHPYTVFQRYDNGTYAMRFTLEGHGQIRIGLRTRDLAEAHRIAERKYMEAEIRAEQGLVMGVASFDKLAQEYVTELEADADDDPQKQKEVSLRQRRGGSILGSLLWAKEYFSDPVQRLG